MPSRYLLGSIFVGKLATRTTISDPLRLIRATRFHREGAGVDGCRNAPPRRYEPFYLLPFTFTLTTLYLYLYAPAALLFHLRPTRVRIELVYCRGGGSRIFTKICLIDDAIVIATEGHYPGSPPA